MDWIDYRQKLGIGFNDDAKFQYFKAIIFNVLNIAAQDDYSGCIWSEEYFAFCNTTGISMNVKWGADYYRRDRFEQCLSIIENQKTMKGFLSYYIALTNSIKIKKQMEHEWTRSRFADLICNKLAQAHIPFDVFKDNDEYFIFPKGARELDDALVSEPLEWLNNYPQTRKEWNEALKDYSNLTDANASAVADKFRKALERFFQEFFSSTKSLENLKSEYGSFMKSKGVPTEISNNLETLQQSYTNFMNNYAKHHDKTSKNVLEYIMYQTGNIIRLLITLNSEGN